MIKTAEELYDDSSGYEDVSEVRVQKGLTEQEKQQASFLYRLFNELWGLCIVRGEPGAGKDTFINWFLYTCKRYYLNKRILRDEKPRKLFGPYNGLFNEELLQEDLKTLRNIAKGIRKESNGKKYDGIYMQALESAADKWADSERARALLSESIIGLSEYWKYVYNREPHKPINKTMGGIHKMGRHFPTLIIGGVQQETDLDKKTCKPFVNWRVTCIRSSQDSTRYKFIVEKVKYDKRRDEFIVIGKPTVIPVDAGKPRSFIGNGKIVIRKPNYKPETEEEYIVLQALKMGYDDYDKLVEFLDYEGAMPETETLMTLKDLCLKLPFKQPKFAIWYPCYYFIFNSRSAPSMTTKVRAEE